MATIKLINRITNNIKKNNGYSTFSVLPFEYEGSTLDEIKVMSGTYNEKLLLGKNLTNNFLKPIITGNKYGKGINVLALDDSSLEKEGNALKISGSIQRFEKLGDKVEFCFRVTSRKSDKEVNVELQDQPEDRDEFNKKIIPTIKVLQEEEV